MQKIKYIIIFSLLLALGMVYKQLVDYQTITASLLKNNTESKEKTNLVQNQLSVLTIEHEQLQNKIILLEETLSLLNIQDKSQNFSLDNNRTQIFPMNIQPLINDTNTSTQKLNLTPNITLDNENEITGFGLQYTQKF
jgi:hypothetical protein